MKWLITVHENWDDGVGSPVPAVTEGTREEAGEALKKIWKEYLDEEINDSAIGVDDAGCWCDPDAGRAQVRWENGDTRTWKLEEAEEADVSTHERRGSAWSPAHEELIAISTVHVTPEAIDFLSEARDSDELSIFPGGDRCVMHIADADSALALGIPVCVKDCIRHALKEGCRWIYFGYDGDEHKELPAYRAKWDRLA